jgi:hypothetical protein
MVNRIKTVNDIEQLDSWLDRVLTARFLEEMKLGSPK